MNSNPFLSLNTILNFLIQRQGHGLSSVARTCLGQQWQRKSSTTIYMRYDGRTNIWACIVQQEGLSGIENKQKQYNGITIHCKSWSWHVWFIFMTKRMVCHGPMIWIVSQTHPFVLIGQLTLPTRGGVTFLNHVEDITLKYAAPS